MHLGPWFWALVFLDPTTNIHQHHELLAKGVLPCIHFHVSKIQLFVSKLLPTGACIPVHKWFITRIFPVEHCRTGYFIAAWLFPLKNHGDHHPKRSWMDHLWFLGCTPGARMATGHTTALLPLGLARLTTAKICLGKLVWRKRFCWENVD